MGATLLTSIDAESPQKMKPDKERLAFDRKSVQKRYDALFEEQKKWVPKWKEIRDFIAPWSGVFESESKKAHARRDDKIFDGTGFDAGNILAAGIMFGLTPRSRQWYKLGSEDPELNQWEPARMHLEEVQSVLYSGMARSNAYNSMHMLYGESGTFGTGAMGCWESIDRMFRTRSFAIGTYALGTDAYGMVNRFAREIEMTPEHMAQVFGKDNLPPEVKSKLTDGNISDKHSIFHMIEPNNDYVPSCIMLQGMPFREFYWLRDSKEEKALSVQGYYEFPIHAPRWLVPDEGIYGYGPGWFALAESRGLQLMSEDVLVALELMIKPPVSVTNRAFASGVNLFPGGVNIQEGDNLQQNAARPVFQVQMNIDQVEMKIERIQQVIKRRFFADLFMMLDALKNNKMTAREVIERSQEKMTLLGPSIERYQTELLNPFISRAYGIALRQGKLPPPPRELVGRELKVEYVSPLSLAQKASGITALEQGLAIALNLSATFPNVRKKIKELEAVDRYWDMLGIPTGILRTDEEVEAMVKEEQAMMAHQMQQEQMMQATEAARNLSQADMSGQNVLTAALGAGPGVQI